MARTATITINGTTYTLCYSTRVLCEVEDKWENQSVFFEDLIEKVSTRVWFLALLMQAGATYDRQLGLEPPTPLTADEIMDSTYMEDQETITSAIMEAMTAGSKKEVEAKPTSKKANAAKPSAVK